MFYKVLFICLFSAIACPQTIRDSAVLLLSFPRSGNTWTRYCIEYITKRPTGEYEYLFPVNRSSTWINSPINNSFSLGVDYDKKPILKTHYYTDKEKKYDAQYLILVVRDYKECLLSHENYEKSVQFLADPDCFLIHNLRVFHNWDPEKRLLIYYEDLMQRPLEVYEQIADFFGEGHENIESFFEEIPQHKKNALALYARDAKPPVSEGKDLHFHANTLSFEQRKHLDTVCEQADPEIYALYLAHYRE